MSLPHMFGMKDLQELSEKLEARGPSPKAYAPADIRARLDQIAAIDRRDPNDITAALLTSDDRAVAKRWGIDPVEFARRKARGGYQKEKDDGD